MQAAHETHCGWCGEVILEGDAIALSEPYGEWCHIACVEDEAWEGGDE